MAGHNAYFNWAPKYIFVGVFSNTRIYILYIHTYIHAKELRQVLGLHISTQVIFSGSVQYIHMYIHRPLVMSAPHKLSKHQNHGTTKLNSTATDGAPAVHTVKQDHQGPTSRLDAGSLSAQVGHDRVELHS